MRLGPTVSARALIGASLLSVIQAARKPHSALTSRRPPLLATTMGTGSVGATLYRAVSSSLVPDSTVMPNRSARTSKAAVWVKRPHMAASVLGTGGPRARLLDFRSSWGEEERERSRV